MTGKKVALLLTLLALIVLLFTACSGGGSGAEKTISEIPVILNQAEYVLYQNIFYNDYASQYVDKPVTKNGIFAVIQDGYNNRTRYYVWGYMDNTRCCDWQWEIVPTDTRNLPAPGSLVSVVGTFVQNDDALDDYWIKDAQISVNSAYSGKQADLNMLAMSDTLERVQILNIMYRSEQFEGKSFIAYGRIAAPNVMQDPYYDGSWQIEFSSSADSPAIGTDVVLTGKVSAGTLGDCDMVIRQ